MRLQNLKNIIPAYTIINGSYEDYEYNEETGEDDVTNYNCPHISFNATSCIEWKEGWDLTLGGLFPSMTVEMFFDEITELDEEDCEEILEGGPIDF